MPQREDKMPSQAVEVYNAMSSKGAFSTTGSNFVELFRRVSQLAMYRSKLSVWKPQLLNRLWEYHVTNDEFKTANILRK